jgi:hypothetical protein
MPSSSIHATENHFTQGNREGAMPITKTYTVYQFAELSDKAKEKARDWLRECEASDFDPDFEWYEDAAKILGIEIDQRPIGTHGGKTRYQTDIRYSGFYSQGDGASFVGTYTFAPGCSDAIRKEFPKDETLHRIADELTVLFTARRLLGKPSITAKIDQDGHYYHKHTMHFKSIVAGDDEQDVSEQDEATLLDLMRDFAQWIYDGLEADYDYRMSNEALDEAMEANEYTFTEDGKRED